MASFLDILLRLIDPQPVLPPRAGRAAPRPRPVHSHSGPRRRHQTAVSPSRPADVLAIAGFGANSFVILPPTSVAKFTDHARIDALAGRYFKAHGATNLSAGLDLALGWITDQRAPACRRVIIITDGEANTEVQRLPALAARLKANHASVSVIYVGSPSGAAGVKMLAERTVGGTFASAADVADIAARLNASAAPPQRTGNNRRWLNVVLVDVSASMTERTPSGMRRIDAVPAAMKSWLALQRANHRQ